MAQRILAFLMLCCLLAPNPAMAEPKKSPGAPQIQKSPEERYLDGLACLRQADIGCAQVTLAGIKPASPYAKILDAQIAASKQDFDTALRLLIPLQAENRLLPQAIGSLHATLALAYENQDNLLHMLEQRSLAAPYLNDPEEAEANQSRIWEKLSAQPRESLLEMRGESPNTATQGWIDLALAAASEQRARAIEQWRSAYPDHPASDDLLARITNAPTAAATLPASLEGKIALLLPLANPDYAAAAEALHSGLLAALHATRSSAELLVYPVPGDKDTIVAAYQRAVQDGAQHVIGPLTREEVGALAESGAIPVNTLALNTANAQRPEKLRMFGQPVETEAAQVAGIGRQLGMQSVQVIAADTPLARRMAEAFIAAWKSLDGSIALEASFSAETDLAELKAQAAANPADMIFLAGDAEQARLVRPYLDQATPTFGTSHIFDGNAGNPRNAPLSAIHFVDMPWLIDPANPEFSPYRQAAAQLPQGEDQRWFATGVDAWHLLTALASGSSAPLHGLTGNIRWIDGQPQRELSMAQFRPQGVVAEPLP